MKCILRWVPHWSNVLNRREQWLINDCLCMQCVCKFYMYGGMHWWTMMWNILFILFCGQHNSRFIVRYNNLNGGSLWGYLYCTPNTNMTNKYVTMDPGSPSFLPSLAGAPSSGSSVFVAELSFLPRFFIYSCPLLCSILIASNWLTNNMLCWSILVFWVG